MWAVLARFGCPDDFTLIRAVCDGMVGRVWHQRILSEPFRITGGFQQVCVLAPTCFSLYVAAMLNEVPPTSPGINLRYRMDGGLFILLASVQNLKPLLSQPVSCNLPMTMLP